MGIILLTVTSLFNGQLFAKDCSELVDFDVMTLHQGQQVTLCEEDQGHVTYGDDFVTSYNRSTEPMDSQVIDTIKTELKRVKF